jgi:KipI family sensor histidine kinase inhibitor
VAVTPPTAERLGARAVRVRVGGTAEALELAAWARAARVDADEVVPGAATVVFDGVADPDALVAAIAGWVPGGAAVAREGPLVEIPVTFDGEDLEHVARLWGSDVADLPDRLSRIELVSAFCGFAPGFAYLAGLPAELAVPRLDSPRPSVPAGSVAVADRWCGIYPTASPGGWRLLGRTDVTLWDPTGEPPALLAPGTRVRLVPA